MNGGSLEQKQKACENLTVPVNDAVKWIHDIAEGLENAGKHGVIHHDVKPRISCWIPTIMSKSGISGSHRL